MWKNGLIGLFLLGIVLGFPTTGHSGEFGEVNVYLYKRADKFDQVFLSFDAQIENAQSVQVTGPGIAPPLSLTSYSSSGWFGDILVSDLPGGEVQTGLYTFEGVANTGNDPQAVTDELNSVPVPPEPVELTNPYDGHPGVERVITETAKPTFEWQSVPGASAYRLKIDRKEGSSWTYAYYKSGFLTTTSHQFTEPLPEDISLCWYVEAYNGNTWQSTTAKSRSVRKRFVVDRNYTSVFDRPNTNFDTFAVNIDNPTSTAQDDYVVARVQGELAFGHYLKVVSPGLSGAEKTLAHTAFWDIVQPDRYQAIYEALESGDYTYTEYGNNDGIVGSRTDTLVVSVPVLPTAQNVHEWTDTQGADQGNRSWHVRWDSVPDALLYLVYCVGEDANGVTKMYKRSNTGSNNYYELLNYTPQNPHPYTNRTVQIIACAETQDFQNCSMSDPVRIGLKKGDVNGDDNVDLADAVLSLQVLAGLDPDGVELGADVDADGKIGLGEVIYILQKVAGLREGTDEEEIRTNFAAVIDAYNNKDIDTLMSYFSLNYMKDGDDYNGMREDFEEDFADPNFEQMSYTISSIVVSGSNATVSVNWNGVDTEVMYWIKESGNWKIYGNQEMYRIGVFSGHWINGYHAEIYVKDPDQNATSVRATGPGISGTMELEYRSGDGLSPAMWWHSYNPFLGLSVPTGPQTYTISITDGSGTYSYDKTITGYVTQFATNLSPTGGVSGTITFSWTGIPDASEYGVELSDSNHNLIWNRYNISSTTTSVLYNGPALTPGETYHYYVVSDIETEGVNNLSFAEGQFTYQ